MKNKFVVLVLVLNHHRFCLIVISVACIEIGPVVDNDESAAEHHHLDDWCARKSDAYFSYCYLYICRYRNAIIFKRLYAGEILSGPSATVRLR